ncbi:MAG: cytidylate kinase family protein [Lachnospiraceae bacterium]|nr:cytidylate kinase family protein [Lachnospiraceae bacterium]
MREKMNISITGNLGSGKSSVAKILKEKGYEIFSTGSVFRQLAMEKGVSVEEFNRQVNEAAERGDRSVDRMIDDTTARIDGERDNVVFDSRLAWHFAPKSFKVFVITDINESSRRVFNDSLRASSEAYRSQEECRRALINRQKLETVRYKGIYGIDYYDMSNYNLVIESTSASPDELAGEILERLEEYRRGEFISMMELNPSSVQSAGNMDANADSDCICVNEKGGVFTLYAGKSLLDSALAANSKFIVVKVAKSEDGGEDSFMNFSKMTEV